VAPLEASSLFGTCGEFTETQMVSPINSLKVLDVQNGGKPGPERARLTSQVTFRRFPRIKLTTSEIVLIRLQTRFNYFAIL
jgi:hypothetical protein